MRAAFVLLMLVTGTIPGVQAASRIVDLTQPGAMDQLKRDNPAHYRAVTACSPPRHGTGRPWWRAVQERARNPGLLIAVAGRRGREDRREDRRRGAKRND